MFFLLSGEGSTDIGDCTSTAEIGEGDNFRAGPMTIIVDQIVADCLKFSMLKINCCGFVSENYLIQRAKEMNSVKKQIRLPGKKQPKESVYFFKNAQILARIAKEQEEKRQDEVVAVLFRDADGTASAGRGLWEVKRKSMRNGFDREAFSKGVPMIPNPKSEAWLICALKKNPYQHCERLEKRSGNDNSPKSLKSELAIILGEKDIRETVRSKVKIDKIQMPSFKVFRDRLEEVIK